MDDAQGRGNAAEAATKLVAKLRCEHDAIREETDVDACLTRLETLSERVIELAGIVADLAAAVVR